MPRSTSNASREASSLQWIQVVLILAAAALTLIGFVMIYSSSQVSILSDAASSGELDSANAAEYLFDQIKYCVIGVIGAFVIWKFISPEIWKGWFVWAVYAFSLVLLIATAVAGTAALGAQRWLVIGSFSLQPSEFAKIAFVLLAARILDDANDGMLDFKQLMVSLAVIVIPLALLYKTQSDLGTTAIILIGCLAVMWLGGVPGKLIGYILVALFVFAIAAIFGTGYRTDRLVVYDPWNDGDGGYGDGYQTIHSFYAFAQGGLFGVGLGNSREKFDYLPEAETDFVFSIIGEELGMVGALVVVALFVVILVCGLLIARRAATSLSATIAGSLTVMIVFQAFLNIGCVIGLVPTTGKPLPFVSSGGSSLIATLIMVGLILSVAKHADVPDIYERRRADLRVVRALDEDEIASPGRSKPSRHDRSGRQAPSRAGSSSRARRAPQSSRR